MRSSHRRILPAVFLSAFLLPIGCQTAPGPAGAAPMGAAAPVEAVLIINEGVDLTLERLDALERGLTGLRKSASAKKQLPVADYVRAVRQAGEAREAARAGSRLVEAWTARRSLSLDPGEAVILTASCFSASPPSAAGPEADEAYLPAEAVDWIRALVGRASDERIRATFQGAIWNLLSGVPFASLPPDQQVIVRGALPDAAERFPAAEGAPAPANIRAAADAMTGRRSGESPGRPEAVRLAEGVVIKVKHGSGIEKTNVSISAPPQLAAPVVFDPTAYLLVPRRSDVTRLALAGFPGLSPDRFDRLRTGADAVMETLSDVAIENIPWSGPPEAFFELLTGTSPGGKSPLPPFDRAVQFGLLAIERIESGGKAIHALRDAAKEAGSDREEVDRMVRVAEGCYEFFLMIGKRRPERLPIKRSYRFGAAVREIVVFLGPGARKTGKGTFTSADGAHTATFDAGQNTILLGRGDRKKRVRIE